MSQSTSRDFSSQCAVLSAIIRTDKVKVVTGAGRRMIFGPLTRSSAWSLLDRPGKAQSRMFFEDSIRIRILAFESERPESHGNFDAMARLMPSRVLRSLESFFYGEASFRDVVKILPCKAGHAYCGLLLIYNNGSRQAVGQVRLDLLQPLMNLDDLSHAWLTFSLTARNHPFVSAVENEKPAQQQNLIALDRSGMLRWWWSSRQCQVVFGDQKSPSMRSSG